MSKIFGINNSVDFQRIMNQNPFLVDVRSDTEFKSGTVSGAKNIPLDSLKDQLSKFKNKNYIVVFCRSGSRSAMAKMILEKNGISNVINGGSWQNVSEIAKELKKQ